MENMNIRQNRLKLVRKLFTQTVILYAVFLITCITLVTYARLAVGRIPLLKIPKPPRASIPGAVACISPTCTIVGEEILRKGGNAADAAVGVQLCLGVTEPHLVGLGGGGFMLIRAANGSYDFVDFRETAPAAASDAIFAGKNEDSVTGGLASGIPGEMRGLDYLYRNYGSNAIIWPAIVAPAVNLALFGFTLGADLAKLLSNPGLQQDLSSAFDFPSDGRQLKEGDFITRKSYASLLKEILKDGPDVVYKEPMVTQTIDAITKAGGIMTVDDLKNYQVQSRKPLEIKYRKLKILSTGAPSAGSMVLNAMKTLEGFQGVADKKHINITTHRLVQALRFAYGLGSKLGDPSYVTNMSEYQETVLSDDFVRTQRGHITDGDLGTIARLDFNALGLPSYPGGSHIVVVDKSSLTVSLSSSIGQPFGSRIVVPETGVILNSAINDFSRKPNSPNSIGPGKRPLSLLSPVIVEYFLAGGLNLALGATGGISVITTLVQTLWQRLDRRLTLKEAIDDPRFWEEDNKVVFEPFYDNGTLEFLKEKGYDIATGTSNSLVQALEKKGAGRFQPVIDMRDP